MKKSLLILGVILALVGIACVVAAIIWQQVLCYQKFGVIFGGDNFTIFIPHPSAFLYVGIVPMLIGAILIHLNH